MLAHERQIDPLALGTYNSWPGFYDMQAQLRQADMYVHVLDVVLQLAGTNTSIANTAESRTQLVEL